MFGFTLIKTKDYPFYKEIKRLIKAHSEYQEGIEKGLVHLKMRPGHGLKIPRKVQEAFAVLQEADDETLEQLNQCPAKGE